MNQDPEHAPETGRTFATWLNGICEFVGVGDAAALKALLAEHGCICPQPALAAWLAGTGTPSLDKMRQVIAALNKATPNLDVWDDYRRYMEGRVGQRRSTVTEVPSLDDLLNQSGLPPGLM